MLNYTFEIYSNSINQDYDGALIIISGPDGPDENTKKYMEMLKYTITQKFLVTLEYAITLKYMITLKRMEM